MQIVFLGLVAFGLVVLYRRVSLRLRAARQIEELSKQRRDGAPFEAASDLEAGKSSKWGSRWACTVAGLPDGSELASRIHWLAKAFWSARDCQCVGSSGQVVAE